MPIIISRELIDHQSREKMRGWKDDQMTDMKAAGP